MVVLCWRIVFMRAWDIGLVLPWWRMLSSSWLMRFKEGQGGGERQEMGRRAFYR